MICSLIIICLFSLFTCVNMSIIEGELDWSSPDAFHRSFRNSFVSNSHRVGRAPSSSTSSTSSSSMSNSIFNRKRQPHEIILPTVWTQCNSATPPFGIENTFTLIDSPSTQWYYGYNSTIWVISENHTLYKSNDDGATFFAVNFPRNERRVKEYPSLDIAGVVISEADKRVMYVYAKSDNHWYWTTTTNGDSFEFHSNPLNVTYIRPHDKLSSIAIGTNWQKDCVRQCSSNYSDWHPNLMFSSDYGKNWEYVAEYAGTAAFVAKSQDINAENADFNKNSLLILEDPHKEHNWRQCLGPNACDIIKIDLVDTLDALDYSSLTVSMFEAVQFLELTWRGSMPITPAEQAGVLFAVMKPQWTNSTTLSVSLDAGATWRDCVMGDDTPLPNSHRQFSVVAALDNALIVAVRQLDSPDDHPLASLYIADITIPELFFNVLNDLPMRPGGSFIWNYVDVEVLDGLDIILANRLDTTVDCLQSVMSFDLGSSFELIAGDSLCNDSVLHCSLHFFGASQLFGAVYAVGDAPGVLFGQGVAQQCLPRKVDASHLVTFFSNNAGSTWTPIHSNSTTYEIAGRGGFLAMSSSGGQITDDFQFSLDFGQSFESCPLPDSFVNVTLHNFLSRSFDHDTFLLDGELQNGAGLLAKVTLSPKLKSCGKPLLSDGSLGTNYDTFSPGHCLLGKHVEIVKRKFNTQCMSQADVRLHRNETSCVCTEKDWECDYCYYRDPSSRECVKSADFATTCVHPLGCVSNGFRKGVANQCRGGVDHSPPTPCTNPIYQPTPRPTTPLPTHRPRTMAIAQSSSGSNAGATVAVVVVLLLLLSAGLFALLLLRRPQLRHRIVARLFRRQNTKVSLDLKESLLDNADLQLEQADDDDDFFQ